MSGKRIEHLYTKIVDNFDKSDDLFNVIKSGANTISHDVTVERLLLDESWINAIDSALRSIENIVRAPKKSILEEHLIVPVEKANKVGQRSIQHLSTHSENIKYANEREIMPSKVMTSIVEENLAIYENRFLITLLNKLARFVDERYKIIKDIIDVKVHDDLTLDSRFMLGRSKVRCNINMVINDVPLDNLNMKNAELVGKVENIKRRLGNLKKSEFYTMLKTAKPVFAPIIKTNILTKNVDYNNAYRLWVFMAGYSEEGFTLEVEHKNLPCDGEYGDDLLTVMTALASSSVVNHNIRREAFNNIEFRKVIDKKYRVVTKFTYKPNFARNPITVGDEVINEYFFRKMRGEIERNANLKTSGGTIVKEENIVMPFTKFYRAITRVSNEIFKDVLEVKRKQIRKNNPTKHDYALSEYNRQKEVYKRSQILSKLKTDELTKTLNGEARELVKLEKLKFELEYQGEKKLDKQIKENIRRVTSRKINAKERLLQNKTDTYKSEVYFDEKGRQEEILEKRQAQISKRREERERRLYEKLKLKYEPKD